MGILFGELEVGGPEDAFAKAGFDFGFCELI
jgi:hypothetical protein